MAGHAGHYQVNRGAVQEFVALFVTASVTNGAGRFATIQAQRPILGYETSIPGKHAR